ncbi:hypothetical protein F53441_13284, partial [Fusarium austroafricanum]
MDPLSATASIIAVIQLSSNVVKYVNAAAGATKERKRLREGVRSCEFILQQLNDGADDSEEGKAWSETIKALEAPDAPLGRLDVALRAIEVKIQPKEGEKKALARLKWPFNEREVGEILAAIEREKSLLGLALDNDCRKLIVEIKKSSNENKRQLAGLMDGLGRIEGSQADLMHGLSRLNIRQDNREAAEQKRRILQWLSPVDPSISHHAALKIHRAGTNDWFLSREEFNNWKQAKNSVLWLTGIPGSGKTILMSTVINSLQECDNEKAYASVAYFYCDFRNPDTRDSLNLLGSLIAQICSQFDSFPKELEEAFERSGTSGLSSSRHRNLHTFSEILMLLTSQHRVAILVDALDECERQLDILKLFSRLGTQGNPLNLLFSSRDEVEIREMLSDFPRIRLDAVCDCLDRDIGCYIDYRLEHDPEFRRRKLKPSFKQKIRESLKIQANGMFLWVRCQLDEIAKLKTVKDIREALNSLPEGLYDTYEAILVKIPKGNVRIVRQILQWLVCNVSNLSLAELHESLAIEPDKDHINEEALLESPEDIDELCPGLIVVTAEGKTSLAHLSVRDYLLSDGIKSNRASAFAFSEVEANSENALSCLAYLSLAELRSGPAGSADDFEARLLRRPFLNHASRWWVAYAQNAKFSSEELDKHARQFFSPSYRPNFMSWVQRAASFGLEHVVRALIAQGAEINAAGGRLGATAFHAAVLRSHVKVMDILFQNGANPNQADNIKITPLHSAAGVGNAE